MCGVTAPACKDTRSSSTGSSWSWYYLTSHRHLRATWKLINDIVHSIYVYYKNNFKRVDSLTLARNRNVAEQQASSKLEFEACGIFAARIAYCTR